MDTRNAVHEAKDIAPTLRGAYAAINRTDKTAVIGVGSIPTNIRRGAKNRTMYK